MKYELQNRGNWGAPSIGDLWNYGKFKPLVDPREAFYSIGNCVRQGT